jgi:hypothetical protein
MNRYPFGATKCVLCYISTPTPIPIAIHTPHKIT